MENDSKEKIIKDWNSSDPTRHFDNFNDLYRYLKGYTKEQGMQSKKDIYNYNILDKDLDFSEKREVDKIVKKNNKTSVTRTLAFRKRIKDLKTKKLQKN